MSEEVTVSFAGETLEVNLYDPASTDVLVAAAAQVALAAAQVALAAAQVPLATAQTALAAGHAAAAAVSASSADYRAERARALVAEARNAARSDTAIKLLVTKDAAKTYVGGDVGAGLISAITPLIGPVNGTQPIAWDGSGGTAPAPAAWPTEDATGFKLHNWTNFKFDNGIVSNINAQIAVDIVFRLTAYETFATEAARPASNARPVGAISYVSELSQTGAGAGWENVPADAIRGMDVNGIGGGYRSNGGYGWGQPAGFLFAATNADGSKYLYVLIDALGRPFAFIFDGAAQAPAKMYYEDVFAMGAGRAHHLRWGRDGEDWVLFFDGYEISAVRSNPGFVPTRWFMGGNAQSASGFVGPGQAVLPCTIDLFAISEGLDFRRQSAVTDVYAQYCGTPEVF